MLKKISATLLVCLLLGFQAEAKPNLKPPKWEEIRRIVAVHNGSEWVIIQEYIANEVVIMNEIQSGWSGNLLAALVDKRTNEFIDGAAAEVEIRIREPRARVDLMDYGIRSLEAKVTIEGLEFPQVVAVLPTAEVINPKVRHSSPRIIRIHSGRIRSENTN